MADLGIPANPNKALWEKGDFTRIAETMRQSGEELVATLGIAPGIDVLDLGCGDGTTALPAARAARTCSASTSPPTWSPPAMRAPRPPASPTSASRRATPPTSPALPTPASISSSACSARCSRRARSTSPREMVRVTRPGGRIVMGNWIPGDPDPGRADPEDQRRLHPAAARRLRQPDDLGRRGNRPASASAPPASRRSRSASSARPGSSATDGRRPSCSTSSATITARR